MSNFAKIEGAFKNLVRCVAGGKFDGEDVYFQLKAGLDGSQPVKTYCDGWYVSGNVISKDEYDRLEWDERSWDCDWSSSFEKKSGLPYPETFGKNGKWIGKREFLNQLKTDLADDGFEIDGKVEMDFDKKVFIKAMIIISFNKLVDNLGFHLFPTFPGKQVKLYKIM